HSEPRGLIRWTNARRSHRFTHCRLPSSFVGCSERGRPPNHVEADKRSPHLPSLPRSNQGGIGTSVLAVHLPSVPMPGMIRVERRTALQDALRSYTVLIDDTPVGTLRPFARPRLPSRAGEALPTAHRRQRREQVTQRPHCP